MYLFAGILRETEKVDREALYCSSALHKMRQNAFHKRLNEHQMRWVEIIFYIIFFLIKYF